MIENPACGWCNFKLGNFAGTPSYCTDVPVDLMKFFVNYYQNGQAVCWFDEEGTWFTLCIHPYSLFIIEERDGKPKLHDLSDLIVDGIVHELIDDIEKRYDGWINWNYLEGLRELNDKELHQRKHCFESLLGLLKEKSKYGNKR